MCVPEHQPGSLSICALLDSFYRIPRNIILILHLLDFDLGVTLGMFWFLVFAMLSYSWPCALWRRHDQSDGDCRFDMDAFVFMWEGAIFCTAW